MTNQLTAERHQEKLCLIEDIIKAQRLAYGMGLGYRTVISNPADVFDQLYDLNTTDLNGIYIAVTRQISAKARQLAGIDNE